MYSGKKAQHDFPKMRGRGGSKAVWNFSENSSVLVTPSVPYRESVGVKIWDLGNKLCQREEKKKEKTIVRSDPDWSDNYTAWEVLLMLPIGSDQAMNAPASLQSSASL